MPIACKSALPCLAVALLCGLPFQPAADTPDPPRYQAGLHESRWELEQSPVVCRLTHAIPLYGRAYFVQRAGESAPRFRLEPWDGNGEPARLALNAEPAPWDHQGQARALGMLEFEAGAGVDTAPTSALSGTLLSGRVAALYQSAGQQPVASLALSPVNFRPAWERFLACTRGLLRYGLQAVRRTRIYFPFDEYTVSGESAARLDRVATYLRADPSIPRVLIEGHADDRGSRRYNARLSQKRAEAVQRYLIDAGVALERLEIRARGAQPAGKRPTEAERARSRRVEVTLLP